MVHAVQVDEACAKVRTQLDSAPEAIDVLERQLLQLEIEATALKKETGQCVQQPCVAMILWVS